MQPAIVLAVALCAVNIAQGMFVPYRGNGFPRPQPFPGPHSPTFPKPGPWSPGPTFPRPQGPFYARARRQADQGSIDLGIRQPLSGPDHNPSIDLNYNHHIIQNDRERLDAYGGGTYEHGRVSPHAGFQYERNFGNGFIGGYGQAQPRPGGGIDPAFGVQGGFRF